MDLSEPMSAMVPSLDSAVLRVLSGTVAPLTGAEIHRLSRRGSYAGVLKVLDRLCDQGLARRQAAGRVGQFIGNRSHLAWPAVEALVAINDLLTMRIRQEIAAWRVAPVAAFLYGSASRRDGSASSDIDIWLVRNQLNSAMSEVWEDQAFLLSTEIQDWTGNTASILESVIDDIPTMVAHSAPILDELRRDAISLAGLDLIDLLKSVR